MSTNRTRIVIATCLLLVGASAWLPTAVAHDCEGTDPANQCGKCLSGEHEHYYNFAGVRILYCKSTPNDPCAALAVFERSAPETTLDVDAHAVDLPESTISVGKLCASIFSDRDSGSIVRIEGDALA